MIGSLSTHWRPNSRAVERLDGILRFAHCSFGERWEGKAPAELPRLRRDSNQTNERVLLFASS